MVRLSSTLEMLVGAGASAAEQYELLCWVRCLSPQGLADRAGVLALLDHVAQERAAADRNPVVVTLGSPTLEQVQVSRLGEAGYLDAAGCEQFDSFPGDGETVARIVAEARAALGPALGTGSPRHGSGGPPSAPVPGPAAGTPAARRPSDDDDAGDTVICRTCGQRVPASARYCGYCGIRIS